MDGPDAVLVWEHAAIKASAQMIEEQQRVWSFIVVTHSGE